MGIRVILCTFMAPALSATEIALPQLKPASLNELVEAERAFAKLCVEKGIAESFYEYFAEDGIAFQPHPVKFRAAVRENQLGALPPPAQYRLDWWPASGDVAESGELGYSTGPTVTTNIAENRPVRYGFYTSVWRKQTNGTWRVLADLGVTLPGADTHTQDRTQYVRATQEKHKVVQPGNAESRRAEMMQVEKNFGAQATQDALAAYRNFMSKSCRIHRNQEFPRLGQEAALQFLSTQKLKVTQWEGIDGSIADSGEFGYSYGRYEFQIAEREQQRTEKGYFLRVWKRDAMGEWKLVAEVARRISERG